MKEEGKQESKDSLEVVIERRNGRLEDFFNLAIPKESGYFRIIGDENKPSVIYNDEYLLACYVKNFELILLTEDSIGEEYMSIKLTAEPKYDKDAFLRWLYAAKHRKIFKIQLSQTPNQLFLCGWNYIDKENSIGKYPVFSKHNPKVFFKEVIADKIIKELSNNGYLIEIV